MALISAGIAVLVALFVIWYATATHDELRDSQNRLRNRVGRLVLALWRKGVR